MQSHGPIGIHRQYHLTSLDISRHIGRLSTNPLIWCVPSVCLTLLNPLSHYDSRRLYVVPL